MKAIQSSPLAPLHEMESAGLQPLPAGESGSVTGGHPVLCAWCMGCWIGGVIGSVLLPPL